LSPRLATVENSAWPTTTYLRALVVYGPGALAEADTFEYEFEGVAVHCAFGMVVFLYD